jgi:Ala-tRNA(Pro) deacylase
MSVCKRLREHLDARNLRYVIVSHSRAYTAQEVAASLHVPGREMAKTVVIKTPQGLALCVVRAMDRVDVELAAARLGTTSARLATEQEFLHQFPDCEMGAMPPLGNLYEIPTLVDEALTRDREIVFNAGTHVDAIRMTYADYADMAKPKVAHITLHPIGARH